MKTIQFYILALMTTFAVPVVAETPNSSTMGWREYSEARGCVWVDKGGYFNLALASDPSDPCPASVRNAFFGVGTVLDPGLDNILDFYRSDN